MNLYTFFGEVPPSKFVAIPDVHRADTFFGAKQSYMAPIATRDISRHSVPVDVLSALQILRDADTARAARAVNGSQPKTGEIIPEARYPLPELVLERGLVSGTKHAFRMQNPQFDATNKLLSNAMLTFKGP